MPLGKLLVKESGRAQSYTVKEMEWSEALSFAHQRPFFPVDESTVLMQQQFSISFNLIWEKTCRVKAISGYFTIVASLHVDRSWVVIYMLTQRIANKMDAMQMQVLILLPWSCTRTTFGSFDVTKVFAVYHLHLFMSRRRVFCLSLQTPSSLPSSSYFIRADQQQERWKTVSFA